MCGCVIYIHVVAPVSSTGSLFCVCVCLSVAVVCFCVFAFPCFACMSGVFQYMLYRWNVDLQWPLVGRVPPQCWARSRHTLPPYSFEKRDFWGVFATTFLKGFMRLQIGRAMRLVKRIDISMAHISLDGRKYVECWVLMTQSEWWWRKKAPPVACTVAGSGQAGGAWS